MVLEQLLRDVRPASIKARLRRSALGSNSSNGHRGSLKPAAQALVLHQMKELLARPGRNGQWSAWLKERAIPRATADRLALKYEQSLHPHANCLSESISEPTEDEIEKLCAKVFPKLRRVLRTQHSLYRFVELMTSTFDGVDHKMTEEGLLIVKPCQLAMSGEFPHSAIMAEPQMVLAQPEVDLDQELM
jgi:hypothetical protein